MASTPSPDVSGGSAGTAAFRADPAAIKAAASGLEEVSRATGAARTYGAVGGVGEAAELERAAAEFRQRWDRPLTAWTTYLSGFAASVAQAAAAYEGTDAGQAQQWRAVASEMPR